MCDPCLPPSCVSRCGPLLSGPGSGLRSVLLPQHHAHSTLTQQTDGPGDGLTNTFPRTHTLQRSQETPHTQQTHAHGRFLGHPVVSGWGTLGIKRRVVLETEAWPVELNSPALQWWSGGLFSLLRLQFLWRPIQICGASSDFFFFFFVHSYICSLVRPSHHETLWRTWCYIFEEQEALRHHCHLGIKEHLCNHQG